MRASLLLFLGLVGCFNPDDILPVHGRLSSVDPVAGQVVRLLRDPQPLLGTSCAEAKPFKETVADEAGNFSFDVFRAQATQLTGLGQFCFRVETTFPSGTYAFSDLLGLGGEVSLPTFPDWRAQPSRVDGVLHFEPAAPLPPEESFEGDQLVHRAEWYTEDGGLAWVADDRVSTSVDGAPVPTRQAMVFDELVLENFSGLVTLRARLTTTEEVVGPFGAGATTVELHSGDRLRLVGLRQPASRGFECPAVGTPCPLTDGDLTPVDAGTLVVQLTLPMPKMISSVVVRGAETQSLGLQLVADDGGLLPLVLPEVFSTSMWNGGLQNVVGVPQPDGGVEFESRSDPRFVALRFDAGIPVSEVRVGFPGGVSRISEISLVE